MKRSFQSSTKRCVKILFSDPYRDPEIDEWAARKIQSSFKQYRRQKTGLSPREPSPAPGVT